MEEIWKDVVGYEGFYQVSNLGRVKSLFTNKIMSTYIGNNQYVSLRLARCNYGKTKLCLLHRIVAEAFIPNPDHLPQVGHKDETRTNNRADNLYWTNSVENNNTPQHCYRIAKGKKNVKPTFVQKSIVCDGTIYPSLQNFCQQHNNMNPPTVWRWLNKVTKMPKEWQERGLKYYD